jgi:hypothetical protein
MRTLEITPEEFTRYEYEINNLQVKEAEKEQEVEDEFLEFMRERTALKLEILKRLADED